MKVKELLKLFRTPVKVSFSYEINSKFVRGIGECGLNDELVNMLGDKEITSIELSDNCSQYRKAFIYLKEDDNG